VEGVAGSAGCRLKRVARAGIFFHRCGGDSSGVPQDKGPVLSRGTTRGDGAEARAADAAEARK
jgi:hypothetical protein